MTLIKMGNISSILKESCNGTKRGREELPHVRGQGRWPGGATPRPRSEPAAGRSYPMPEVRDSGQECQAVTMQEWP